MSVKPLDQTAVNGMLKEREKASHKGVFGSLLCLVGSDRYRGAATLAARGALMCGAGLIAVASSEKALAAVAANMPEAILFDTKSDLAAALVFAKKSTAMVIGSGLTDALETESLVSRFIMKSDCPLVIDADGINMLCSNIELLKELKGRQVILTPHIGEFSRLTGKTADEIMKDRAGAARDYAREHSLCVVLKSDRTVVAFANGEAFENTLGNSGLAKGGSGDLLSGIIGSIAAMGYGVKEAALLGVFIHSRAADLCAELMPKHSMSPCAVAEFIPTAISELLP